MIPLFITLTIKSRITMTMIMTIRWMMMRSFTTTITFHHQLLRSISLSLKTYLMMILMYIKICLTLSPRKLSTTVNAMKKRTLMIMSSLTSGSISWRRTRTRS